MDALLADARGAEERARAGLLALGFHEAPAEALRYVASRLVEGQRSPRVPPELLAQEGDALAETLRDVSTLRQVLRFALALAQGAKVRWSELERTVHGESEVAELLRGHEGRLVLLDAAANVEELRAVRSDLHVERIDVDDAGDAERTLLFAKHTTRTALLDPKKRADLLGVWLGAVLERLTARRAQRPVFVVYKTLKKELAAHPALVAWLEADPRREVRMAHFGALRGSNRFKRCDAVVTLCDPWLNGDDVTGRAERLGLDEPSYRVALTAAELGQAHGRSRSVRRARRLTHVHVGRLVPDGWTQAAVEPLGGPPERTHEASERIEFRALVGTLGGQRAAAVLLGASSSAIAGWRSGRRGLPREMLEKARALVASSTKSTGSSDEVLAVGVPVEMDAPLWIKDSKGRVHQDATGDGSLVVAMALSEEPVLEGSGGEDSVVSEEGAAEDVGSSAAPEIDISPLGELPEIEGSDLVADEHSESGAFLVASTAPPSRSWPRHEEVLFEREQCARREAERFERARQVERLKAEAFARSLLGSEPPVDLERFRAARVEVEAELQALHRRRDAG
jgi:hypothetical protein